MSKLVWIPAEKRFGVVETEMLYGAIVHYSKGGIEFHEMLAEEDYEPFYGIRKIMEEEDVD